MAQRLLIEPQSGDEDSDCEEDDLLLKDPTQSYYNVNFAPVLKVSYLLRLQVLVDAWGKDNFFWFLALAMKIEVVFLLRSSPKWLMKVHTRQKSYFCDIFLILIKKTWPPKVCFTQPKCSKAHSTYSQQYNALTQLPNLFPTFWTSLHPISIFQSSPHLTMSFYSSHHPTSILQSSVHPTKMFQSS